LGKFLTILYDDADFNMAAEVAHEIEKLCNSDYFLYEYKKILCLNAADMLL